jgi:hypothetical protein
MPIKRIQRAIVRNQEELYSETLRKRGVKFIDQYETPVLNHPTSEQIASIGRISHIWKHGDRFFKLAQPTSNRVTRRGWAGYIYTCSSRQSIEYFERIEYGLIC